MRPLNWIILGILALLSVIFVGLYFLLGFNKVDWPQGMVLGIVWWIVIVGVGCVIALQARAYRKREDDTGSNVKSGIGSTTSGNGYIAFGNGSLESSQKTSFRRLSNAKRKIGHVVLAALLVPTLALSSLSTYSLGFADDVTDDHNDPWFYKLSDDSTGIDLFYSVDGAPLETLAPGQVLEESHQIPVEFFVRPKPGYLVDSTFLHSGNEYGFVTPDVSGVYSKVGTNELPGFEDAVKQALEMGCTKEFHYSFVEGAPWRWYIYREFSISTMPFEVHALFDLNGGEIDGKATYADLNAYYGSQVKGHGEDYLITLPSSTPVRDGYTFEGWTVADKTELFPAGASINIEDYWRYLYDHSNATGANLPITAQWKAVEDADVPADSDTGVAGDDSANGSSGADSAGTGGEGTGSSGTGSSGADSSGADSEGTSGGAGDSNGSSGADSSSGSASDEPSSSDSSSSANVSGSISGDASSGTTTPGAGASSGTTTPGAGASSGAGSGGASSGTNASGSASNAASSGATASGSVSSSGAHASISSSPHNSSSSAASSNVLSHNKPSSGAVSPTKSPATSTNPMTGDVDHGKKLASRQVSAGIVPDDIPLASGIDVAAKGLRDGIYIVEDSFATGPKSLDYGISNANRGCWVCGYMVAGIVLTLLYGAVVVIYRAITHRRKESQQKEDGQRAFA